ADLAEPRRFRAEFLLPGRRVGQGDEVARPLVQLRQVGPGPGSLDVAADVLEDLLHAGLAVDRAINMPLLDHVKPPFGEWTRASGTVLEPRDAGLVGAMGAT